MAKKKAAKGPSLVTAFQKHTRIRKELLTKQQALKERDTMRMAVRQSLDRKNAEMELKTIQGQLHTLPPGIPQAMVRQLKEREKHLKALK